MFSRSLTYLGLICCLFAPPALASEPVRVAVSDPTYGDIARQIGGPSLSVDLLAPDAPAIRDVAHLAAYPIILCDGSPKGAPLCAAAQRAGRQPLSPKPVAAKGPPDAYPWYDTKVMAHFAQDIAKALIAHDPAGEPRYAAGLATCLAAFAPVDSKLDEIAKDYANSDVFLADRLFAGAIDRLKFRVVDEGYLSNKTAVPSMKAFAALKQAISMRKASILIYDRDATDKLTADLVDAAGDAAVPAVGLREHLPSALRYQQWMARQINAVRGALNEAAP